MAENAAALIDEVLVKLSLNTTNPTAITRATVLLELNNGLRDLAENTSLFLTTDTTTLVMVSGTASYTLPEALADIYIIKDHNNETIYPTTLDVLETMSIDWADDTGDSRWFILGYDGPKTITFYKKPSTGQAGRTYTLRYYAYPTDLTDSATSYLPSPIARNKSLLLNWTLGQLKAMDNEVQDLQKSQFYLQQYYSDRNKWAKKTVAPNRLLIFGSTGKRTKEHETPQLPDNYPALRL